MSRLAIILLLIFILLIIIIVTIVTWDSINNNIILEDMYECNDPIPQNTFPFSVYIINLDRKPERFLYVSSQLDNLGIKNYKRWSAVDGFNTSKDKLMQYGITETLTNRQGLAGCASSHLSLLRYIRDNKMDWTLILEDDAHLHPDFMKIFSYYWTRTPRTADIVFLGHCGDESHKHLNSATISRAAMCLHGYMISWKGAEKILANILPINEPIDIALVNYLKRANVENPQSSIIYNGNICVTNSDNIKPDDYKNKHGKKCMFDGIIYQNHEEQGSTIHNEETVFN